MMMDLIALSRYKELGRQSAINPCYFNMPKNAPRFWAQAAKDRVVSRKGKARPDRVRGQNDILPLVFIAAPGKSDDLPRFFGKNAPRFWGAGCKRQGGFPERETKTGQGPGAK